MSYMGRSFSIKAPKGRNPEDVKVSHRTWKAYSGPSVKGSGEVIPTPGMLDSHWDRAFWLTSMVESGGRIGAIVMYDGTAVTAGLHQAIAVYPRNLKTQGPFFSLLRRMNYIAPVSYYLGDLLDAQDWFVAEDSKLRVQSSGQTVEPREIRNVLTPVGGKVPKRGYKWKVAREWAVAFHLLFSLDSTLPLQTQYGIEHFVKRAKRQRHHKLDRRTVEELCYKGECLDPDVFEDYPTTDLAMAMYWQCSVNGPAPALTRLARTLKICPDVTDAKFARTLIRQLGTASYGRWDGARYDRARQHAMQVWPKELFEGRRPVMPRSF